MRVLLVSANFRPHVGGIEEFTAILAGGLADRGHDVTVLCCRYEAAPLHESLGAFDVIRVPSSYVLEARYGVPYPLPDPRALLARLRTQLARADVVHVQDAIYATSTPTLLLASRRGVAAVLTQHVGFVPQRSRALDTVQRVANATLGRCARLATRVATLNPAVADWAREEWSLPEVRVLPVGIPESTAGDIDRAEVRRSFGLAADRFVVLFVGRDVPKKGLDVLLAAADDAYDLVAVTDREGADPRGTLIPFMRPARLAELLRCVDAFALPSEGEGFPLSLQEALAAGLPVVTTRQDGYERFLDPDDVLYVERDPQAVRDALVRLAADGDLRRRLGVRARAVAKRHFGVEAFVSAYEALYEETRAERA